MALKNKLTVLHLSIILILTGACSNFFHEVIPPNGNRIISFEVSDQLGEATIGENSISVVVKPDTDVFAILPNMKISHRASVLPLTWDYMKAAFPNTDIAKELSEIIKTNDIPAYVWELIQRTPDFSVPPLVYPINFYNTVEFLVISGLGELR